MSREPGSPIQPLVELAIVNEPAAGFLHLLKCYTLTNPQTKRTVIQNCRQYQKVNNWCTILNLGNKSCLRLGISVSWWRSWLIKLMLGMCGIPHLCCRIVTNPNFFDLMQILIYFITKINKYARLHHILNQIILNNVQNGTILHIWFFLPVEFHWITAVPLLDLSKYRSKALPVYRLIIWTNP